MRNYRASSKLFRVNNMVMIRILVKIKMVREFCEFSEINEVLETKAIFVIKRQSI